jgi:hypothetical protein
LLENVVPALWAVPGDVAEGPNSLLADVKNRRQEEVDEFGDSICLDHNLCVFGCSRGNVGQRPGSLELDAIVRIDRIS